MSAAPAAAPRPVPPRPSRGAGRTPLTVVPARSSRPVRAPFVLLVVLLLSVGLAALLAFNTALAQGSFAVSDLQRQVGELDDRSQSLEEELARSTSPARLAESARAIGMVPAPDLAYISLAEGTVSGRPDAAPGAPPPLTAQDQAEAEAAAAARSLREARKAAADAEAARVAAEEKRAAQERAAAEKAAAEKAAAEKRAADQWRERLAAQADAGARDGGEQVLAPPKPKGG